MSWTSVEFAADLSKIAQFEGRPNDARKLVGYEHWRADLGEYRIVYRFDDETVFVILIANRNNDEIYKRLGRKCQTPCKSERFYAVKN